MTEIVVLRLIHIVFGAFWFGTMAFFVLLVEPAVRATGPSGAKVVERMVSSHLIQYIAGSAVLTVLSGLRMYQLSYSASAVWVRSPMGRTLGVGALLSIVALVIGLAVTRPTVERLTKITRAAAATGGPPNDAEFAEIGALRARLTTSARWVAGLLLVAAMSMAVARYTG